MLPGFNPVISAAVRVSISTGSPFTAAIVPPAPPPSGTINSATRQEAI
jgi:hypothetical protein